MERKVAVIGAGIAGLTAAFELIERSERLAWNLDVCCLEASDRPGGNIQSERADGFLCEWGPNGFLDNAPCTLTLARRLGLEPRRVSASAEAAIRFVVRRGKPRRIYPDPIGFLTSDILSLPGRLRVCVEPLAPRGPKNRDESVFDFASRRIGREAASVLVDAMVAGIYGGNSRELSVRATFPKMANMMTEHGSLFRAMLAKRRASKGGDSGGPAGPGGQLNSFRDGMQELPDALAKKLGSRLELGQPVRLVSDMGQRGYRLLLEQGPPRDVDAVILAVPAWSASRLLGETDPELAQVMAKIPSAPLAVVHFGYRAAALGQPPEGFGFLIPGIEESPLLGTLFASNIFEARANEGGVLLTSMVGGARHPEAVNLDDSELIAGVREELGHQLGVISAPYFTRIFRHPRGIPQYTLGHPERLAEIDRRLERHSGLWVAGNSYRGISVNACVEQAPSVAETVLDFLDTGAVAAENG